MMRRGRRITQDDGWERWSLASGQLGFAWSAAFSTALPLALTSLPAPSMVLQPTSMVVNAAAQMRAIRRVMGILLGVVNVTDACLRGLSHRTVIRRSRASRFGVCNQKLDAGSRRPTGQFSGPRL